MIGFTRGWTVALGATALLAAACQRQEDASRRQSRSATDSAAQSSDQAAKAEKNAADKRGDVKSSAAAGTASGSEHIASGQVVSAKQDELVLRQGSGAPDLKLKVSPSTTVTMGGRQASISELKEGTQVRAAYQQQGGDQQAIRIEALSGASGSGAPNVGAPPAGSTPPAATPGSTGSTGTSGSSGTENR